jgi:hypothetical protein
MQYFNVPEPYEHYDHWAPDFVNKVAKHLRDGVPPFPGTVPPNKGGTYPYIDAML